MDEWRTCTSHRTSSTKFEAYMIVLYTRCVQTPRKGTVAFRPAIVNNNRSPSVQSTWLMIVRSACQFWMYVIVLESITSHIDLPLLNVLLPRNCFPMRSYILLFGRFCSKITTNFWTFEKVCCHETLLTRSGECRQNVIIMDIGQGDCIFCIIAGHLQYRTRFSRLSDVASQCQQWPICGLDSNMSYIWICKYLFYVCWYISCPPIKSIGNEKWFRTIQIHSCLFTCKLNTGASYKVNTST
jgi:hypothetical protein